MRSYLLTIVVIAGIALSGCSGDFRELARGANNEVIVVMDSTKWDSETALALEATFGKYVMTLPNPEPYYDLVFVNVRNNDHLERVKKNKNLIFAAPIDEESNAGRIIRGLLDDQVESRVKAGESFAFPFEDQWYRDQWALILTSTSDSLLAQKIRNTDQALTSSLLERELARWEYFVYEKKEQVLYSDTLWNDHGFKVRIQHDYIKNIDTTNFVSYHRYLPNNDRWMWIWWQDDVRDIQFLDNDWINATRDSLLGQYIRGSRDSSYVATEYRREVNTRSFQKGRLLTYETLGTWQMINDAMGGPFVNFTYYDPDTKRLFMVEYAQFAPSVRKKLRFVRQFRAMGRTFESDSTWNENPAI